MVEVKRLAKLGKQGEGVYGAFLRLDWKGRRSVAMKILGNQRLLSDLRDHFMIRDAMRERRPSIRWSGSAVFRFSETLRLVA